MPLVSYRDDYPLHRLGWKAFQDLCVAVAEEILKRPVQTFLPSNDAGRDGAFIGTWAAADASAGSSTIQCKFTGQANVNLTLSMLDDELEKAGFLAKQGLAADYIILTNHPVTGRSDLKIRAAFKAQGVGECRIFHRDWIVERIRASPRLRMMAPRLYGMGDLSDLMDARAYKQAQLILSELGEGLKRLVVTEAHRRSVRAIDRHGVVLLLGAPASGKSTIGASLAIGAADTWNSYTIKATSPEDLRERISPDEPQFFWIDDAWGSTQYQRDRTEAWNQVLPLMQAALKRGTRFLLTSRDYIWKSARAELKLQSLPALQKSQVIIDVEEFTIDEKARIIYNHLKLGDQSSEFRADVKQYLPDIVRKIGFLPEVARRLGDSFFTSQLHVSEKSLGRFFSNPEDFLVQTISQLDAESRAALATVFMSGGVVRSPVDSDVVNQAASSFGAPPAGVRDQLTSLNESLLLLAQDEYGPFWKFKHPTIGDAYARYLARDPERIRLYLLGAKPSSISREVVCAGVKLGGTTLVVPDALHSLLAKRLQELPAHELASFLSYRSNKAFSKRMLDIRQDIFSRFSYFITPIADDMDAQLLARLNQQGLLPEEYRLAFIKRVRQAAIEDVDASFLDDDDVLSVLTPFEKKSILAEVATAVLGKIEEHVSRKRADWDKDYSPDDHFNDLKKSVEKFTEVCVAPADSGAVIQRTQAAIQTAIFRMEEEYEERPLSPESVVQKSTNAQGPLEDLFRDVDE